jgi:hypothetical protein
MKKKDLKICHGRFSYADRNNLEFEGLQASCENGRGVQKYVKMNLAETFRFF